jgi:hypothetical protein
MQFFQKIRRSDFFIKLKSWEYWPFGIIQAPIFIYWLWLSLKARSLLFFSAANPGILTGGMFGESKFSVLEKIPGSVKPKAILIHHPTSSELVIQKIKDNHLSFPLIFKPDLGERGWMVRKVKSESELIDYLKISKWDFIIQEFVDWPLEFSVYYARHPKMESGKVTSVTIKEMLKVTGDGRSKLSELILAKDRAKLQWHVLKNTHAHQLDNILGKGEQIELVSVGNHCLGTTFINKKKIITKKMVESFDQISKQIEGFYFGRYDLRVQSISDLEQGKIMIMELNGCGAEPSHIYHPGASMVDAIRDLFIHWHTIYTISKANHKKGIPYMRLGEGIKIYKKFKAVTSS